MSDTQTRHVQFVLISFSGSCDILFLFYCKVYYNVFNLLVFLGPNFTKHIHNKQTKALKNLKSKYYDYLDITLDVHLKNMKKEELQCNAQNTIKVYRLSYSSIKEQGLQTIM